VQELRKFVRGEGHPNVEVEISCTENYTRLIMMFNSFFYINMEGFSVVILYNKNDRNFTPSSKRGGRHLSGEVSNEKKNAK
jgi:hypothetical protein